MRTHPDMSSMTARQQTCSRLADCATEELAYLLIKASANMTFCDPRLTNCGSFKAEQSLIDLVKIFYFVQKYSACSQQIHFIFTFSPLMAHSHFSEIRKPRVSFLFQTGKQRFLALV